MNTKLVIKDTKNEILQTCIFNEQEALDAFLIVLSTGCPYGKPAYDEILEDESIIHHESEYTIETIDITEELEAIKLNRENKRAVRKNRIDSLSSIDWTAVTTISHCKHVLKIIIAELLKEE